MEACPTIKKGSEQALGLCANLMCNNGVKESFCGARSLSVRLLLKELWIEKENSLFFPQRHMLALHCSQTWIMPKWQHLTYEEKSQFRTFFFNRHATLPPLLPPEKEKIHSYFFLSTFKCAKPFLATFPPVFNILPTPKLAVQLFKKTANFLFNKGKIIFFHSQKWFGYLSWTLSNGFIAKQRKENVFLLHLATNNRILGKTEAPWDNTTAEMLYPRYIQLSVVSIYKRILNDSCNKLTHARKWHSV